MVISLLTVILLAMYGCSPSTPATSSTASVPPASTAPASVPPTQASPVAKTLVIGEIGWSGWSFGLDMKRSIEVKMDMINKAGGLQIGPDKYILQLNFYDTNGSQAGAVAAANKLVYEDHVKYTVADPNFSESYLQILQQNKVIDNAGTPSMATVKPGLDYCFFSGGANFQPATSAWYVKNYPNNLKNYVIVAPDNQMGHFSAENFTGASLKALGVTPTIVYYPAGTTDLGAVATKVVSLKPTSVDCTGAGEIEDSQAVKAIWQAGYTGQFFTSSGSSSQVLSQFVPASGLSQYMGTARVTEFDPPLTQEGIDFKNGWIAKYGKWEYPGVALDEFNGLIAAMQQAGSLDPDKIMAVAFSGMKFTSLGVEFAMVSRPDLGNPVTKTNDSIGTTIVKSFKDGKPFVVKTISPKEGLENYKIAFPNYNYSIP